VAATVRAVTEPRTGGHGSRDSTRNLDDGAVSLTLRLYSGTRALLDEFGAYLHPAARPVLTVTDDEWGKPRQVTLRFDAGNSPIELGAGRTRSIQYQWRAPAAVWEADSQTVIIGSSIPVATGVTWDQSGLSWTTVGLAWPASSQPSPSQISSAGNIESEFTALLRGPCTAPRLFNDTTGQALQFKSTLTLALGDYVAIDTRNNSAQLNGDPSPSASVLSNLDYQGSDWWRMQPGLNVIRYAPIAADAGSVAEITFSESWMPG
jgi:hypothetical protein